METMKNLSELSDKELALELKRRNEAKVNDRIAYKQLVEDTTPDVVKELMNISSHLTRGKAKVFDAFKDILTLKEEVYGVKDNQQSHTFTTDDYSITFGYRMMDHWDDSVHAGVNIINDYLKMLAKDEESKLLVEALTKLLRPDKNGNLKPSKVLEMQQLANAHQIPELLEGVKIITEGHRRVRSNWFIEATCKAKSGLMESIPLSISTVDFPVDFSFDFLTK